MEMISLFKKIDKKSPLLKIIFLFLTLFFQFVTVNAATQEFYEGEAVVYWTTSTSCPCSLHQFIKDLELVLKNIGVTRISVKNFETDPEAKKDLEELYQNFGIPESMHGIFVVSIDKKFLFINYVPLEIMMDFLKDHAKEYRKIVIFRDLLRGSYVIIDEEGKSIKCNIDHSISECFKIRKESPTDYTILIVLIGGLLDGINPCILASSFFFVTFLMEVDKSLGNIDKKTTSMGIIYIMAVFLTRLIVGIWATEMIAATHFSHLVTKISAWFLILFGLINLKGGFSGKSIFGMRDSLWKTLRSWMRRATIPSTFISGFLVNFFGFPCTGIIYIYLVGILSKRPLMEGLSFLIIYNIAFTSPLMAIVIFARIFRKGWKKNYGKVIRLILGFVMMALGAFLIIFNSTI